MNLKDLLLEAKIENIKKSIEDYVDETSERNTYEFPYRPNTYFLMSKGRMGDYGYVLKIEVFDEDNRSDVLATALILEGQTLIKKDRKTVFSKDKVLKPPALFGKLLEIIK